VLAAVPVATGGLLATVAIATPASAATPASCTLRGYPGVLAATKSGTEIGDPATRSRATFATETLAPGKQSNASVGIVDTGNFSASSCKPVTATGLKIFPPNQSRSVTLQNKFSACSSTTTTSLTITPIK
jgi:hypothetical protein